MIHKRILFLEEESIKIDQAISDIKAALDGMEEDMKRELALDREEEVRFIQMVIAKGNSLKADSRWFLAKYLADPSATSILSSDMNCDPEEMYQSDLTAEIGDPDNGVTRLALTDFSGAERSAL